MDCLVFLALFKESERKTVPWTMDQEVTSLNPRPHRYRNPVVWRQAVYLRLRNVPELNLYTRHMIPSGAERDRESSRSPKSQTLPILQPFAKLSIRR